jgi:hypothetical protein
MISGVVPPVELEYAFCNELASTPALVQALPLYINVAVLPTFSVKLVEPKLSVKAFEPLFVTYSTRPAWLAPFVGVGTVKVRLPAVALARIAELESIRLWVIVLVEPLEYVPVVK